MENPGQHPEQDPAEGSRETIERDLARQDGTREKNGDSSQDRRGEATFGQNHAAAIEGAEEGLKNTDGELPKDQI